MLNQKAQKLDNDRQIIDEKANEYEQAMMKIKAREAHLIEREQKLDIKLSEKKIESLNITGKSKEIFSKEKELQYEKQKLEDEKAEFERQKHMFEIEKRQADIKIKDNHSKLSSLNTVSNKITDSIKNEEQKLKLLRIEIEKEKE